MDYSQVAPHPYHHHHTHLEAEGHVGHCVCPLSARGPRGSIPHAGAFRTQPNIIDTPTSLFFNNEMELTFCA